LQGLPFSVQASKMKILRRMAGDRLKMALSAQEDYPEFQAWRESDDIVEGILAFVEKRKPVWKGQ
jgi:enoyl-CoA hydratase/carnithine racemase